MTFGLVVDSQSPPISGDLFVITSWTVLNACALALMPGAVPAMGAVPVVTPLKTPPLPHNENGGCDQFAAAQAKPGQP
ncbi:hypothetical protein [Novosphingobium terrae]|uniref:hypothetical protein n=1 Tax=Novosphingobium terrae TaxID=2726189 RepID=UPI0019800FBF|nr:hypothetical protein [Novosphingobium terrae]